MPRSGAFPGALLVTQEGRPHPHPHASLATNALSQQHSALPRDPGEGGLLPFLKLVSSRTASPVALVTPLGLPGTNDSELIQ